MIFKVETSQKMDVALTAFIEAETEAQAQAAFLQTVNDKNRYMDAVRERRLETYIYSYPEVEPHQLWEVKLTDKIPHSFRILRTEAAGNQLTD